VNLSGGATTLEDTDAQGDDTSSGYAWKADIKNGPMQITAAYAYENMRSIDTYFGIGVIYTTSKTEKVSVGWSRGLKKRLAGGADSQSSGILALGYEKNLGKGAKIKASVFNLDSNADAIDFNNWGGVAGITIAF